MFDKENPETIIKLKLDEKNMFEYSFMALGVCIMVLKNVADL